MCAYIALIHPPPAPSAWFMELREPNLTQRMRNELSPSPTTGTTP